MTRVNIPRNRKRRHGLCKTCLWHWPELHGEDKFLCYCPQSEHYHEEFVPGCRMWEGKLTETKRQMNWGKPPETKYVKSTTGYGRPNERE